MSEPLVALGESPTTFSPPLFHDKLPLTQNKDSTSMAEIPANQEIPSFIDTLEPYFKARLVFPGDLEAVYQKAKAIAPNGQVSKEFLQQAILLSGFKTKEELRKNFDQMLEAYFPTPEAQAPIEEKYAVLMQHARTQAEFKAISGITKLNVKGVKSNFEDLSIQVILDTVQTLSAAESEKLHTAIRFDSKAKEKLNNGALRSSTVQTVRSLLSPKEFSQMLETCPKLLLASRLEVPETEDAAIEVAPGVFVKDSSDRIAAYSEYSAENWKAFHSLPPDEKLALLKNKFLQQFLDDFNQHTPSILAILKKEFSNTYLTALEKIEESSIFSSPPSSLEQAIQLLDTVFDGTQSLADFLMQPDSSRKKYRAWGLLWARKDIVDLSLQLYGKPFVQQVILNAQAEMFTSIEGFSKMDAMLSEAKHTFGSDVVDSHLGDPNFLDFLNTIRIYETGFLGRTGNTIWENLAAATRELGVEGFFEKLSVEYGEMFLLYYPQITKLLSPELIAQIFSLSKDCVPSIVFGLFFPLHAGNDSSSIELYAKLDSELRNVLLTSQTMPIYLESPSTQTWVHSHSTEYVSALLHSYLMPPTHLDDQMFAQFFKKIDMLENIFGTEQILALLTKSNIDKNLQRSTRAAVQTLSLADFANAAAQLQQISEEDKTYIIEHDLLITAIKHPDKAAQIRTDITLQLTELFESEPLLRKRLDILIDAMQVMQSMGKDIDTFIEKITIKLKDPRASDVDKIWYIFSRIFGLSDLYRGTDPSLENATFASRVRMLRQRLYSVHTESIDQSQQLNADQRNRAFMTAYQTNGHRITEPVLLHGKSDVFPQDWQLGLRAAEFLGSDHYIWDEETANALNCMITHNPDTRFIETYTSQDDTIAADFGASSQKETGITHILRVSDVVNPDSTKMPQLYEGIHHGKNHKLVLVGVPITNELCAVVNGANETYVQRVKKYYAKLPFYVGLLDARNGEPLFTEQAYDTLRNEMLQTGEIVDTTNLQSVEAFINRILLFYSKSDDIHGVKHIENCFSQVSEVCTEIFSNNQDWFTANQISFEEFQNIVKIATVGHDLARDISEGDKHALVGSQILTDLLDFGLSFQKLELITTAIKQHNLGKESRWSDDPITQALYDVDKADTAFERGADASYLDLIMPTIQSEYTRSILQNLRATLG